jgi:hypothetical protein
MSFRRHKVLFMRAAGVVLVCVLAAGLVRAQCHHGGGSMLRGGSPLGALNAQMLQLLVTQNLLQQQQQLQLIQQQMLQKKRLNELTRELAGKGPEDLKKALRDPRPEMRWLAALVVGKQAIPLSRELIELLTDDHPQVRQAARQSLVRLSKITQTKSRDLKSLARSSRAVDFGPAPTANRRAQQVAARKWGEWLTRREAELAALKDVASIAPEDRPMLGKPVKVAAGVAKEKDVARLGKRLEHDTSKP